MDYDAGGRRQSMVLVSDGAGSAARGQAAARQADLTLAAELGISEAAVAEDAALAGDLLFVEVAVDCGAAYDALVDRVARLARGGQPAILSIVPELIDPTMTLVGDAPVTILCGSHAGERVAAIAMLLAQGSGVSLRQDDACGPDSLRTIGEDLGRIATRLLGLTERRVVPPVMVTGETHPGIQVTAADFRRMLRDRRLRDVYLGQGLFADPAWDMLLDLAAARIERVPVAVSSLCIAAAVPPTTALRWIQTLTEREMVVRIPDPRDGRRVFVTLSPAIADAMAAYVRATKAADRA